MQSRWSSLALAATAAGGLALAPDARADGTMRFELFGKSYCVGGVGASTCASPTRSSRSCAA